MSRRKRREDGRRVIEKVVPLIIPFDSKDPRYMNNYMRLRRQRDRIDPGLMRMLEEDAEAFFRKVERAFKFRNVLTL